MNISERFDRLDSFISNGTLLRNEWGDGQERACLLLAIAPEAKSNPSTCPTEVLPLWLSRLTLDMDDRGSLKAWPEFVRRYAEVVRAAAVSLDKKGWRRAHVRCLKAFVMEGMSHTKEKEILEVCIAVMALCDRVIAGDEPTADQWSTAQKATTGNIRIGWGLAPTRWWVLEAADRAVHATRMETATELVAHAVAEAAEAAAAAETGVYLLGVAHRISWNCMNTAILDALEIEVKLVNSAGHL